MKTATFIYKCRKCGELERGLSTNPKLARDTLLYAALDLSPPDKYFGDGMFHRKMLHNCKNGMGIADIIGYVEE